MKKILFVVIVVIFIGIFYLLGEINLFGFNEVGKYNTNIERSLENTDLSVEVENQLPIESIKADNVIVEDFITSYERIYIQAINKNRVYLLADFFEKDSELYNKQMQIISNYNKNEVNVVISQFDIIEIKQENKNSYFAKAIIEYELTSPKGQETKVFHRQYTIIYKDSKFIITDLKEFNE